MFYIRRARNLVYKAEVQSMETKKTKTCIGMTVSTFRERFTSYKRSFNDIRYEKQTEHSKHVWKSKRDEKQNSIQWSILSLADSMKAR